MRVAVVHYDLAEAAELAARLRRDGIDARPCGVLGAKAVREIRAESPDAILIDLLRMPSYGRAIGALLREQKSTRSIPLVFLAGDPEKTARAKELLPDAAFATLPKVAAALRRAVGRPPANPAVPDATKAPLAGKLRIRSGDRVGMVGAPEDFEIGGLPADVDVRRGGREGDVVLVFVKSPAAVEKELRWFAAALPRMLWLVWPKRASGVRGHFSLTQIHEACGAVGLVGYMTCAVDRTWSAVAVSRRKGRPLL